MATTATPTETTTITVPAGGSPLDERLLDACLGSLELISVYLGSRLGLYALLGDGRSRTVDEVAVEASIAPRYAREWLEQQAVAGILVTDDDEADDRRFALPAAHVGTLVDPTATDHLAPLAHMVVGIAKVLDEVVAAYRSGGGVPYHRYGADFRHGQGTINRPAYTDDLVDSWLAAIPELVAGLRAGGRIADLGCGVGWSTIALAEAFPAATVIGIDEDVASIDDARRHAEVQGAPVRFEAADASELRAHGPFDAVLVLEALHDMARPVEVLISAREALGDGGSVVIADENVAPHFTSPGDETERLMYGWSVAHCLPAAMAEQPSAAIGTVIREDTVRQLAAAAGFSSVEVMPVDAGFFRIYRLRV